MPFDEAFLGLMPLTVTVKKFTGYDGYGRKSFAPTPATYRGCRQPVNGNERVAGFNGQIITPSMKIYLDCRDPIGPEDEVVLPSGENPQKKPLQGVKLWDDEDGPHHTALYF